MSMTKTYVSVLAVIISSILCMQCSNSSTPPMEIVGVWTTPDENYAGESIEFTSGMIIMNSVSRGVFEYTIDKVKSKEGHLYNSTLYTVYYTDQSGEKNLLNLIYTPEEGGTLMFKSEQDIFWKRI